jgi:hypothetical protein
MVTRGKDVNAASNEWRGGDGRLMLLARCHCLSAGFAALARDEFPESGLVAWPSFKRKLKCTDACNTCDRSFRCGSYRVIYLNRTLRHLCARPMGYFAARLRTGSTVVLLGRVC